MTELPCPMCAETIPMGSVVCPICGSVLSTLRNPQVSSPVPPDEPPPIRGFNGAGSHDSGASLDGSASRPASVSTTGTKSSSRGIAIAGVLAVAVFVAGGVTFAFRAGLFGDGRTGDARAPGGGSPDASTAGSTAINTHVAQLFHCTANVAELAAAFLALPTGEISSAVRVHPRGGEKCLGVPPETNARITSELVRILGSATAAQTWDAGASLAPSRVTLERWTPFHAGPARGQTTIAQAPGGTVGMALVGMLDGNASVLAPGNDRSAAFVAASGPVSGWTTGRNVRTTTECVPTLEVLRAVSPARFVADSAIQGTGRVWTEGQLAPASWIIERHEASARSRLAIFRVDVACAPTVVHDVEVSGWVADLQLTDARYRSGPTLVVLGAHPGGPLDPRGTEDWTIAALGNPMPSFARRIPTGSAAGRDTRIDIETSVHRRPDGLTGYWPMRLKPAVGPEEFFSWTGSTLNAEFVYEY